jgi:hypothetical protein
MSTSAGIGGPARGEWGGRDTRGAGESGAGVEIATTLGARTEMGTAIRPA